jgi:hypothetical protein
MIFGRVIALGLSNLAKYLAVTTFFRYAWRLITIHSQTKNQVNISNHSDIKW